MTLFMNTLSPFKFAHTVVFLVFALAFSHLASAQARLTAQPDRTSIAENETLQVTLRYENGTSEDDPDLSVLANSFDIMGNNRSSQYLNSNGKVTRFNQWTLTLAPKRAGKLLIPPFTVGGTQSQPVTIQVSEAKALPKGSAAVFLETHVSKSEVYVQEEFIVTLKLFFKENLVDVNAAPFTVDNASIEELPRSQYQTTVVHARYDVIQLRFAVTPDASGQLEIPSFLWSVRTSPLANSRFGFGNTRTTLHRLRTDTILMNVKPRPANYPNNAPWLPARDVSITQSWSQNPPQFTVGEPITRTITVNAKGLSGEQLPPLSASLDDPNFKFYADQPNIESDTNASGKFGSRKESVAIVPNSAGEHILPAVRVTWWDVDNDELKVAELPAQTVFVQAGAATAASPQERPAAVLPEMVTSPAPQAIEASPAPASSKLWLWLAAGLFALNLAQLALWFFAHRPAGVPEAATSVTPKPAASLKHALAAAKSHDALACKRALQQAGEAVQAYGLHENTAYQQALGELNRTLYGAAEAKTWNGQKLAQILSAPPAKKPAAASGLLALYP